MGFLCLRDLWFGGLRVNKERETIKAVGVNFLQSELTNIVLLKKKNYWLVLHEATYRQESLIVVKTSPKMSTLIRIV